MSSGSSTATPSSRDAISEAPTMHRLALLAISLLLVLFFGEAGAHAMLDRAEPRAGNKVAAAPHAVKLWFTEKLEPAFSTVIDIAGRSVDSGQVRVSGDLMSISLRPAEAGTYHVIRQAVAVHRHTADGNFTFQVEQ
jgi:methionine-rich copper-binding protein CopC